MKVVYKRMNNQVIVMKQFTIGLMAGVLLTVLSYMGFSLLSSKSSAALNFDSKAIENAAYEYVDFRYKDLALSDVGLKVDGEIYVSPDKLLALIGKQMNSDQRTSQLIITDKPENVVLSASTAALGQLSKSTIGDMLDEKFQSQHWDADPEEENKLVFSGIDLSKNHYEIVFWINKANEMAIQTIYLNGTELSEQAKVSEIKRLFGTP